MKIKGSYELINMNLPIQLAICKSHQDARGHSAGHRRGGFSWWKTYGAMFSMFVGGLTNEYGDA